MNNPIKSLVNHAFTFQSFVVTGGLSDSKKEEPSYLLAREAALSKPLKETLEDDQVTISADAIKSLFLEQQGKTRESAEADAKQSDLLDELIEETKDKIDQAKKALEEVVGNTESAKQHRKALQTQLMLLNNQLLLLINQKADNLEK